MEITWVGSGKGLNNIDGVMSHYSVAAMRKLGYDVIWTTQREFRHEPKTKVTVFQDIHFLDFGKLLAEKRKYNLIYIVWAYADSVDKVIQTGELWDHVFESAESCADRVRSHGIESSWLPFAAPDGFVPWPQATEPKWDVIYIGSAYGKKEARFQELLAPTIANANFFLAGYGREYGPLDHYRHPHFYARANVCVHVTVPEEAHEYKSPGLRVMETMACKKLLITDHWRGVEDVFDVGRELVVADNADDFLSMVRYYIAHPAEREKIATAGFENVNANHRYINRMRKISDVIVTKNTKQKGRFR